MNGGIDEIGEGLGIERAGTADDDQRMRCIAVLPPAGNPRQVEHVENVAVGEFVLQGKADDVETPEGLVRFEGGQRLAGGAQLRFQVGPGGESALGGRPIEAIDDVVQDGEAEMAHPHFVDIGKSQRQRDLGLLGTFADAPPFPPKITGWAIHFGEKSLYRHGFSIRKVLEE